MPVWSWFFIAAATIIALTFVLIGVLALVRRRRTDRLESRFGPEYGRVIPATGDQRAGEE
jgi:Ca2+/H+ antiporter